MGIATAVGLGTVALAGCTRSAVDVHPPVPSPLTAERCAHLGNALPQRIESLRPRVISPRTPLVHAWGSPAVVLTCGVASPVGYVAGSPEVTTVGGVTWFEQRGATIETWTAVRTASLADQTVFVRFEVPTSYRDQGAFLLDVSPALRTALPDT